MDYEEAASWRQWTNLLARVRFGTQTVAGRTISGTLIKSVLERVATYADGGTGDRVRPGIARIAVDLETSYNTVRNALTIGERVGLLRVVRAATRTDPAEYQLVIGAELIEKVELWTPAQYGLEVRRFAEKYRGKHRSPTPEESAVPTVDTVSPTPEGAAIAELPTPGEPAMPLVDLPSADSSGAGEPAIADSTGPAIADSSGGSYQPVTNHKSYQPGGEDLRTDVAVARAQPDQDPDPAVSDLVNRPRCPHGRSPRRDHTGPRCPQCRTEAGCPTHGPAFTPGQRPDGRPNCPLCRATGAATP